LLTAGNIKATFDETAKWLRMERGTISAICNFGGREQVFPVTGESRVVVASQNAIQVNKSKLVLPPDSVAAVSGCSSRNA
jgi:hypothetical protein